MKKKNQNHSSVVYKTGLRYLLVVLIFMLGVSAFFGAMISNITLVDEPPSSEVIETETANLLEQYPEFVDWNRQSDEGIAIWLPNTFEAVNAKDVVDYAQSGDIPEDFPFALRSNIDIFANTPGKLQFLSFDQSTYLTGYMRHVLVVSTPGSSDQLDDIVNALTTESTELTVLETPKSFKSDRYTGKYFVTATHTDSFSFATVYYIVPQNNLFYMIAMQTSVDQVDESQEIMEKAMNTLWVYTSTNK